MAPPAIRVTGRSSAWCAMPACSPLAAARRRSCAPSSPPGCSTGGCRRHATAICWRRTARPARVPAAMPRRNGAPPNRFSIASLPAVAGEERKDFLGGRARRPARCREADILRPIVLAVLDLPENQRAAAPAIAIIDTSQPTGHGLATLGLRRAAIGRAPQRQRVGDRHVGALGIADQRRAAAVIEDVGVTPAMDD